MIGLVGCDLFVVFVFVLVIGSLLSCALGLFLVSGLLLGLVICV